MFAATGNSVQGELSPGFPSQAQSYYYHHSPGNSTGASGQADGEDQLLEDEAGEAAFVVCWPPGGQSKASK